MPIYINKHEGPINNYENCTIYNGTSQPNSHPTHQSFQHVKDIEDAVEVKRYPVIFRTDYHKIDDIEAKVHEAFRTSVKTNIVRCFIENSKSTGYFRFDNLTNKQKAEKLNEVKDLYYPNSTLFFTESDFENANKPLKK